MADIKVPNAPTQKRVAVRPGERPEIQIVELPADVSAKWKSAWLAAFKEAQNQNPEGNEAAWNIVATQAANKTLHFADPTNYDEAMDLEDWQVIRREEQKTASGVALKVVTRHGRGFSFPVPPKRAPGKSANGNGADDKSKS